MEDQAMRVALLLLATAALGCSQSGGPQLGKVTGTVTLDGAPVEGAGLEFIGEVGAVGYGRTDSSGNYYVSFGNSRTGAPVGKNLVRITAGDNVTVGGKKFQSKEVFPKRYNANSDLYVDVKSGSNTFDFKCESAGETVQPPASRGGN
jgi:hypothetical protein